MLHPHFVVQVTDCCMLLFQTPTVRPLAGQLLSKLETQYQGENVIIVGADSDCLSVLQSFVLGEDMGKHSK